MLASLLAPRLPLVLVLGFVFSGCGEVITVPSGVDPYAGAYEAQTSCETAAPPCSLDTCAACPSASGLDTGGSCACCTAGALPDGMSAPYALRVHGAGLDEVSGRTVFATAGFDHIKEGRVVARTIVCGGQFDLRIAGAVPAQAPGIAAFIDRNDDGLCDSEIDPGGDASLFGTTTDVDLEMGPEVLSSKNQFACEHFGHSLTVRASALNDAGVDVLVRLHDASGKRVSERRTATAPDGGTTGQAWFRADFFAPLRAGDAYRVDVLLDRDGDDACDPATDVAWRRTLGPVTENETVELTGNDAPSDAACVAFASGA
jgi:hypothetical protein